jgi:hypothetical protein
MSISDEYKFIKEVSQQMRMKPTNMDLANRHA